MNLSDEQEPMVRKRFIYCSSVLFLFACTGPEEPTPAPPAVGENRLEAPAQDTDGLTRVLVLHDMEGLSGQQDPDTFRFSKPEPYAAGREYLVLKQAYSQTTRSICKL